MAGTQKIDQATQGKPLANVDYNGKKITNLADPASAQDAATKAYVDASISGSVAQISVPAPGLVWSLIVSNQVAVVNNGYICNKGTLLILTLPVVSPVGSMIRVAGMSTGLWNIAQPTGTLIHFGNQDTTPGTGGYMQSILAHDSAELVCVVANNEWNVVSSIGNIMVA